MTLWAVTNFVDLPFLVNLVIVAIIWYSADKLTRDCTVMDEQQEACGQGLLAHLNAGPSAAEQEPSPGEPSPPAEAAASPARKEERGWWRRFIENRRKRHAPGLWVIYLSLVALPEFGILHGMIPESDASRRGRVFMLLLVYIASALALLMTTTFLNLRRYLRQKQLEMPLAMAGAWLTVGCVLIASLLIFCLLLPRPGAGEDLLGLNWRITSRDLSSASRQAKANEGADQQKPGSGTTQGKGEPGEGKTAEGQKGEPSEEEGREGNNAKAQEKESVLSEEEGGSLTHRDVLVQQLSNLKEIGPKMIRWIVLGLVIVAFGLWASRHADLIIDWFLKFLAELRDFWRRLLPARRMDMTEEAKSSSAPPPRPFAKFENPFASGLSHRLSPDELVKYSFEAMEAWAAERGCGRHEQQTPHEFGREVARKATAMATEAVMIAELYSRVAYAKGSLTPAAIKHVERLWEKLGSDPNRMGHTI